MYSNFGKLDDDSIATVPINSFRPEFCHMNGSPPVVLMWFGNRLVWNVIAVIDNNGHTR